MNSKVLRYLIPVLALGVGIWAGMKLGIHSEKVGAATTLQQSSPLVKADYLTEEMWAQSRIHEVEYRALALRGNALIGNGGLYVAHGGIDVEFNKDYVFVTVVVGALMYDAQGRHWRDPDHMAENKMTLEDLPKWYEEMCVVVIKKIGEELHIPSSKIRIFWQSCDSSGVSPGAVDEGFYVDGKFSVTKLADKNQGIEFPKWVVRRRF